MGCGVGMFLQAAQHRGWSVTGIDPSVDSIREAEKSFHGAVHCATLETFGARHRFDVVTLINVLDHMLDMGKEVAQAHKALKDGGLIYLRVPNGLFHASMLRLACRLNLGGMMQRLVIFHNYSLTPDFMRRLLKDNGFSRISIRNSPLAGSDIRRSQPAWRRLGELPNQAVYLCASALDLCSGGRLLFGPSLEVTAVKSESSS